MQPRILVWNRPTIKLTPDHQQAHVRLAAVLYRAGRYDEAQTQLSEAE